MCKVTWGEGCSAKICYVISHIVGKLFKTLNKNVGLHRRKDLLLYLNTLTLLFYNRFPSFTNVNLLPRLVFFILLIYFPKRNIWQTAHTFNVMREIVYINH